MNKFNLFLILISSIVFSLMTRVIEGACNYNFESESQKKLYCNNSQIGATQLRQQDFQKKVGNLFALAEKTRKQVFKNEKNITQNAKNNKALEAVADPNKDEDTSDACKQYPEAC